MNEKNTIMPFLLNITLMEFLYGFLTQNSCSLLYYQRPVKYSGKVASVQYKTRKKETMCWISQVFSIPLFRQPLLLDLASVLKSRRYLILLKYKKHHISILPPNPGTVMEHRGENRSSGSCSILRPKGSKKRRKWWCT